MAKQALDKIKEAENRSSELTLKAQADAAKIIADANVKADEDMERLITDCRAELDNKKAQAAAKAEEEKLAFSQETDSLARELEQKLMSRQDAAVESLIKVISEQ